MEKLRQEMNLSINLNNKRVCKIEQAMIDTDILLRDQRALNHLTTMENHILRPSLASKGDDFHYFDSNPYKKTRAYFPTRNNGEATLQGWEGS